MKGYKRCQWSGCRKLRQHPGVHCRKHQAGTLLESVKTAQPIKKVEETKIGLLCPEIAVFGSLIIAKEDHKHFVLEPSHLSSRIRYHLPAPTGLHAVIRRITRECVIPRLPSGFKYRCWHKSALYIIAPPNSKAKRGPIHRDCDTIDEGYYSVILCVDDVTEENGCIHYWPETELVPLNVKVRKRAVAGRPSEKMTGVAGTLFFFDARTLHQSDRNNTDGNRATIQWWVTRSTLGLHVYD